MVLGVAAATLALAVPSFTPHPAAGIPTGAYLQDITVADMTGDGIPDIVATRLWPDHNERISPSILAGDGKGGFTDVTPTIFVGAVPTLSWPRQTVIADFNGDGRADIFFGDTGYDAAPFAGTPNTLVLSAPGGKLVDASANLPINSTYTHSAAAADVNGDGKIDIYEGNICCGEAGPRVLLNDGTGHFSILPDALPSDMVDPFGALKYTRSAFADVNGDGSADLVLAGEEGTPDAVLLNDGKGHFHRLAGAVPPKPFGGGAVGLAVRPLDVNGDGKVDLLFAFTKSSPFYVGRWIQVDINNGDGTFRDETASRFPAQSDANTDGWPYAIEVADLNGDGKPDLGVSVYSSAPGPPRFYLNKGDGTFAELPFASPPANMFAFLDANRDGRMDIVDAAPNQGLQEHYRVWEQNAPAKPKPKPKKKPRRHHP